MSHQAYSWVLAEGPRLTTVDRSGRPYGTRARAMRAVLASIANAANAAGENSHPGLPALVAESLYGKSHVLRIVTELVAEGWLEITEEGRGRGHATVYRIRLERQMVPPRHLSGEQNGPIHEEKRCHPEAEKVPSGGAAPLTPNDSTKDSTRREAARLCALLSELMVANGCRPPSVTETWLTDMERLIRIDERPPAKVEAAIRWCQADSFWRGNILSPRKLREKYDQLRLAARSKTATNGHSAAAALSREGADLVTLQYAEANGHPRPAAGSALPLGELTTGGAR